jgi:hypothetical protein
VAHDEPVRRGVEQPAVEIVVEAVHGGVTAGAAVVPPATACRSWFRS